MTRSPAPSLHTHDIVALAQDAELDGLGDPPLQATVDVLLPIVPVEIRLGLLEEERVHATVEMGILPIYEYA